MSRCNNHNFQICNFSIRDIYSTKYRAMFKFMKNWFFNPNPPDPLPLLAPADLFAIPFSTV